MKWLLVGVVLFVLGGGLSFTWSLRQQETLSQLSQACASEAERFLHRPGSVWSGPWANPIYATHYNRAKRECLMQLEGQAQIDPLRTSWDRSEVIDPVQGRSLLLFVRAETNFVLARRIEYQPEREDETKENSSSEAEGRQLADEFRTKSLALMTQ